MNVKVELEAPLNAMLKGCLWMGGGEEGLKGGQDEASQQYAKKCRCQKIFADTFTSLFCGQ
ncbi:MAG: hypothetical protein QW270_04030 [Candidatus Bathyarchaeia archaeon]